MRKNKRLHSPEYLDKPVRPTAKRGTFTVYLNDDKTAAQSGGMVSFMEHDENGQEVRKFYPVKPKKEKKVSMRAEVQKLVGSTFGEDFFDLD